MNAPKKIWVPEVWVDCLGWEETPGEEIPYIRADIVDELVGALKASQNALEGTQPLNYCTNGNGERFPMIIEDPFKFDRIEKAIAIAKAALAKLEESHD